jgi:hypothetical protein
MARVQNLRYKRTPVAQHRLLPIQADNTFTQPKLSVDEHLARARSCTHREAVVPPSPLVPPNPLASSVSGLDQGQLLLRFVRQEARNNGDRPLVKTFNDTIVSPPGVQACSILNCIGDGRAVPMHAIDATEAVRQWNKGAEQFRSYVNGAIRGNNGAFLRGRAATQLAALANSRPDVESKWLFANAVIETPEQLAGLFEFVGAVASVNKGSAHASLTGRVALNAAYADFHRKRETLEIYLTAAQTQEIVGGRHGLVMSLRGTKSEADLLGDLKTELMQVGLGARYGYLHLGTLRRKGADVFVCSIRGTWKFGSAGFIGAHKNVVDAVNVAAPQINDFGSVNIGARLREVQTCTY